MCYLQFLDAWKFMAYNGQGLAKAVKLFWASGRAALQIYFLFNGEANTAQAFAKPRVVRRIIFDKSLSIFLLHFEPK